DSIVIALKTNSPIYVSNKLEKHMVSKEKFLGEDIE
ncbi:MAG: bifunctional nuclease family protein, partial [Thermoprotei archaeon]